MGQGQSKRFGFGSLLLSIPTNSGKSHKKSDINTEKESSKPTVNKSISELMLDNDEPLSPSTAIPLALSKKWTGTLLSSPRNQLAMTVLSNHGVCDLLFSPNNTTLGNPPIFSIKIPTEGTPVTTQRASGRCWIFAALNVMRIPLIKNLKLSGFEFSQSHLAFWDKYEKANFFLEKIIELCDLPEGSEDGMPEGRLWQWLLRAPVNDGGQWDMLVNVVEKYGLVPQSIYPDTFAAKATAKMNWLITRKLREAALRIRDLRRKEASPGLRSQALINFKLSVLKDIHTILALTLGPPIHPESTFTWEYVDNTGAYHTLSTTPLDFYHDIVDYPCNNYFSLVNDPRHPSFTTLKVQHLGNVVADMPDSTSSSEGLTLPINPKSAMVSVRDVRYINVPIDYMKKAAMDMLKSGTPVFFGCDVSKFAEIGTGKGGWLDTAPENLHNYSLLLGGIDNGGSFTKAERLKMGESLMTHAMVFTGVHVDPATGKTVRWRVENSWGAESGDKGYLVMSDEWFGEYVYQIVTGKEWVGKDVYGLVKGWKEGDEKDVVMLPVWDPMGSLA